MWQSPASGSVWVIVVWHLLHDSLLRRADRTVCWGLFRGWLRVRYITHGSTIIQIDPQFVIYYPPQWFVAGFHVTELANVNSSRIQLGRGAQDISRSEFGIDEAMFVQVNEEYEVR